MKDRQYGTIGVLMGGYSSEREISLRSGQAVAEALSTEGHRVRSIDITSDDPSKIIQQIQQIPIDIAFIALHGRLGEDGGIQGILEKLEIPYTGSGVQASQSAFNKITTQKMLAHAGLPVPENYSITDGRHVEFKAAWGYIKSTPLVVKPACEGSSIGVNVVRHPSEWEPAFKTALNYGPQVIVEEFIKGREFTAGVLGAEALPVVEIIPKSNFFNFASKYQKGATQYVCPAEISEKLAAQIKDMAVKAGEAVGCEGFWRVDVRMDEKQRPYILEINTIPGFTSLSLFPKAAQAAGHSFVQVCEKLLDMAYGKKVQR